MKTSTIVWVVLIIIVVVGGGWYWYSTNGTSAPPSTQTTGTTTTTGTTGQTTSATVLQTSTDATLGSYLSAPLSGMTLYTYAKDTAGVSNCTGQCATNWPPYIVEPGITLLGTAGVGGQLGTVTRGDGSSQLTYNGAPLYTYIKDSKPGDVSGQNINSFVVAKP